MKVLAIIVAMLSGCSVGHEVDLENSPKVVYCKDIRDGEQFSFKTETVKNVSLWVDDICMDVLDERGEKRHLCKSHEAWLKCQDE